MYDSANPEALSKDIYQRFRSSVCVGEEEDYFPPDSVQDLDDGDEEVSEEAEEVNKEDLTKPEVAEKRRKRLRRALLRRKSLAARAYQFSSTGSGVQGIVFIEIVNVTDLPPEKNGRSA